MTGAADSDDYAQSNPYLDPGQDLGLDRLTALYRDASDNTATVAPTYPSVDSFADLECFRDAFGLQYNVPQCTYPLPIAAQDYQQLPYPNLLAQTLEANHAYHAPGGSQTILLEVGQRKPSYAHARDASGPEIAVDRKELSDVPQILQHAVSYQEFTYPQPPGEPRTLFLATEDPFRDGSTPYVPGHTAGGWDQLHRQTDAWTAVAEQSELVCDNCGQVCKSKTGLNHHKVKHDKSKVHRHKCDICFAGFRYPKDLKRHHDTRHGEAKYPCAECRKTYKRKDHLARHLLVQGHTSPLEGSSGHSTASATADLQDPSSRRALDGHQNGHVQLNHHSNEHGHSLNSLAGPGPGSMSLDTPETYSYPGLLEVPRLSRSSLVNGSQVSSFTVSEVESFSGDTFDFKCSNIS